ncbi:Copper resistance protein A precursor [compost metagenome]
MSKRSGETSRLGKVKVALMLLTAVSGILSSAVSAHSDSSGTSMSGMEASEAGTQISVNGHTLAALAHMNDDLTNLRVPLRDVIEALGLPLKWDAKHKAVLVGQEMVPSAMLDSTEMSQHTQMGHIGLYIHGQPAKADADPMMMNNSVYVLAEDFAQAMDLKYTYDAGSHQVKFMTQAAADQFTTEQKQVEDVLNGVGMVPHITADGTKEFTLTAGLHDWSPLKGVLTTAWTFNGQAPAPTIRVTEGDRVRIVFNNNLPEPSTVHLHGLLLPNAMDGVPWLTQPPVQSGKSFTYEFTASHAGTFMYHSHYDDMKQVGSGMYGAFIIDPKKPVNAADNGGTLTDNTKTDHDYTMLLSGFHVNTTMEGEEDYYTINGRSYPDTPPIEVKQGEISRVRLINMDTMEVHTMHLHGMDFYVVARNGSPLTNPERMNNVMLGPGETVDLMFRADNPGDWAFHCHILDHTMNGESDMSGGEMGGLVTVVKVKP